MLRLQPKIHSIVSRFIAEKEALINLVQCMGGSLNIVFPQIFSENIEEFKSVFNNLALSGRVYYAHKANQSSALVRQAHLDEIYVDVASANELKHALSCGFRGNKILATGPKNKEYLYLAVSHSVLISIDSLIELEYVSKLASKLQTKQPLLLRLSGFSSSHKPSRFGIPIKDLDAAITLLNTYSNCIDLKGLSFHLDTSEAKERLTAIEQCFSVLEELQNRGFSPSIIDIGGGFRQVFLEDTNDLDKYSTALKLGILGQSEALHWPGVTFGYRQTNDRLEGIPTFHRYANQSKGYEQLTTLLTSQLNTHSGDTQSLLKDSMANLYIEPGKALLDHVGITVSQVESIKYGTSGEILVHLNIKRDDLVPADQAILLDPVILYRQPDEEYESGEHGIFFAGNLCLEKNLIYSHKTFVSKIPQPGDLVMFINTAAYQMDLSASEALMQPKLKKVAVVEDGDRFCWYLDEHYLPI